MTWGPYHNPSIYTEFNWQQSNLSKKGSYQNPVNYTEAGHVGEKTKQPN